MVRLERCCCGCCSVKTGSLILGWITLVGSLISIGGLAAGMSAIPKDEKDRNTAIGVYSFQILMDALSALAAICLLNGIYSRRHGCMVPYLITCMLQIIGNIIVSILIFIYLPMYMFASASITLILNIYFYIVIYSHYKEVQEDTHHIHGYA